MTHAPAKVDRAALVRRALVELVAKNGFRGTSMAAVAERAGVATGTAYVHYESKDELVIAAYVEVKKALASAAAAVTATGLEPAPMFAAIWHAMYEHLAADPVQAHFLVQVEASPYAVVAHDATLAEASVVDAARFDQLKPFLAPLPPLVLWDLGMGPAVRAVASGSRLTRAELTELAAACWRAVSRP